MHHSSDERDRERIRRVMRELGQPLGATGQFPQGKLTPKDEGELRLGIGTTDDKIVMDFGKATAWIGFDAEQALALADTLRARANALLLSKRETDGKRKTVCVDLDGVLAHYEGWKGVDHIGEPRPGAADFMRSLQQFARVVVYTTRTKADFEDRPEGSTPEHLAGKVRDWLDRHGVVYDEVYTGQGKPFCAAFVDDRAVPIRANPVAEDFAGAIHAVRLLCR